ncbi:hypothetical protein Glove_139g142 [Diversispora epigaea]|uniref:Uncharacterized protein n=1 Tax=Diversispora epigaea TaxID=1348612 RepID=A0A397IW03_9GLOM|nr:hypothetical protein Glove_139g142 [Diversispora epigaea]
MTDISPTKDYIKYLEKVILIRDDELDSLRQQITDIKKRLQKTLQTSISQEKYIDYLEKQLVIFQENLDALNEKIEIISSRRSSPDPYTQTSEEQDTNMAAPNPNTQILEEQDTNRVTLDLFILINQGLNCIENHLRGGTPLNNPINIINGIRDSLNALTQDGITLQNNVNRLTQERDNLRNLVEQRSKVKRALEIIYKVSTHRLRQELRQCNNDKVFLQFWYNRVVPRYEKWKNKTHGARQTIINLR